jgi:hypothetical protein
MMPTCEPRLDQSSISYILNLQCLSVCLSGQFPGTARTFVFFALLGPLFFFFLIPRKKIQRLKRLCKSSATRVVIMEKL